jgi:hypothetical protein
MPQACLHYPITCKLYGTGTYLRARVPYTLRSKGRVLDHPSPKRRSVCEYGAPCHPLLRQVYNTTGLRRLLALSAARLPIT